ncbi:MAG: tRNA uridine(34) 5-carboxymethylaminomethyl modification radical SAM/GNAT enzyme Elp3 [Candidatus Thermoplasmatota archaeon]|nr:tRNA uridine(34) 5-carboxymethylaminomethyl modification radical SAM/GNAT enzyme Elp3 [Candidatus Thermoplasmatota archaeon]
MGEPSPTPVPEGPAPKRRKPTRSLSGVSVVAVMTSPFHCPHGRCTYCPGGPEYGSPQSYTGEEPSAMRGSQLGYDPYLITRHRLDTLAEIGHSTSKVEVILMGGTFTSRPADWQEVTIKRCFDALNRGVSPDLASAHQTNETADSRCVGLTIETRPDQASEETLRRLVSWGVTRIEFGVETLRDEVLDHVHRAHDVEAVVAATQRARDLGLKVAYHMMPGLPGMDPAKDLADFGTLFQDERFQPDMLKIYPCLVMRGTPLYDEWKRGEYRPYDTDTAARLLADVKEHLPRYVRIQRVQRDIPARLIADGVRKSNLREIALALLHSRGKRCPCLRCREVGRRAVPQTLEELELRRIEYAAGHGREVILSLEDPATDTLAGFLRLRFPSRGGPGLPYPMIRELKVLGIEVPVGGEAQNAASAQHRGYGQKLIAEAAEIARSAGAGRMAVISAVGTRGYYARLGFVPEGPWMSKPLD